MVLNPCPCMSLQKGCIVLALVDAVISMLNLGLLILALVTYKNDDDPDLTKSEKTAGIIVVIILMVICVLQILLAYRLHSAARKKDYRNSRIWLIVTAITTGINIGSFILNLTVSDFNGASFSGTLPLIIYKLYEMTVVYTFLTELKMETQMGITTYATTAQPQPPPHHYNPDNAAVIYVTPQSQQAYPMQQFGPPPPYPTNQGYPAPVHHVTAATTTVLN